MDAGASAEHGPPLPVPALRCLGCCVTFVSFHAHTCGHNAGGCWTSDPVLGAGHVATAGLAPAPGSGRSLSLPPTPTESLVAVRKQESRKLDRAQTPEVETLTRSMWVSVLGKPDREGASRRASEGTLAPQTALEERQAWGPGHAPSWGHSFPTCVRCAGPGEEPGSEEWSSSRGFATATSWHAVGDHETVGGLVVLQPEARGEVSNPYPSHLDLSWYF